MSSLLPSYIHDTLAPDPHPVRHAVTGLFSLLILILATTVLMSALIVASPFLLLGWVAGGCPDQDGVPLGVPRSYPSRP